MNNVLIPVSYWTPPPVGTPRGSREQAGVEDLRLGPEVCKRISCAAPLRWSSDTAHSSLARAQPARTPCVLGGVAGAVRGRHGVHCGVRRAVRARWAEDSAPYSAIVDRTTGQSYRELSRRRVKPRSHQQPLFVSFFLVGRSKTSFFRIFFRGEAESGLRCEI